MPFKFKLSRRLARLKQGLLVTSLLPLACVSGDKLAVEPEIPPPPAAQVTRLVISPTSATVSSDQTVEFSAVGLTASGDTAPVVVAWFARRGTVTEGNDSKPGKRKGHYKAPRGAGTDTVVAVDGDGNADTASVTVTEIAVAEVAVTPTSANLTVGQTVQLQAVTRDANGNTLSGRAIAWRSSSSGTASVSDQGLVTGRGAGTATITATSEGVSATSSITVTQAPVASVTVSPASASVEAGKTVQLSATVKDANGTTLSGRTITWSTNASNIATVSNSGVVSGVAAGSATITATSEGKSGTAQITVSAAPVSVASVTVSPASASVEAGKTVQLSATAKDANGNTLSGRTITWSTNASSIATVSSSGVVSGISAGSATITATSEGKSGTAEITVTAPPPPPPGGTGQVQYRCIGLNCRFAAPASASWSFGDGTTRSGQYASHAFERPGSFTVRASWSGGSWEGSVSVVDIQAIRPSGACLDRSGPVVTISGQQSTSDHRSRYGNNTTLDARGATWDAAGNVPIRYGDGSAVCLNGGRIIGRYDNATSWSAMHDTYALQAYGENPIVDGLVIYDYGDGFFPQGNGNNWVLRNVLFSYIRDDCVQNDYHHNGTIDRSLFDGCYVFYSSRRSSFSSGVNGSDRVVTMTRSLVRLQPMPTVYSGSPYNHKGIWKIDGDIGVNPRFRLVGNIFRVDQNGGVSSNMRLTPPNELLVECRDNVIVWLGSGSFPDQVPSCFTVVRDVAVWDAAVEAWLNERR